MGRLWSLPAQSYRVGGEFSTELLDFPQLFSKSVSDSQTLIWLDPVIFEAHQRLGNVNVIVSLQRSDQHTGRIQFSWQIFCAKNRWGEQLAPLEAGARTLLHVWKVAWGESSKCRTWFHERNKIQHSEQQTMQRCKIADSCKGLVCK